MSAINSFLVENGLRISSNPCVSPDFCLDWPALRTRLLAAPGEGPLVHPKSGFSTAAGAWSLVEDSKTGDCAWKLIATVAAGAGKALADGATSGDGAVYFPATWENLLRL